MKHKNNCADLNKIFVAVNFFKIEFWFNVVTIIQESVSNIFELESKLKLQTYFLFFFMDFKL